MCIFAFAIREMYEFKTYNIMRKINLLKGWMRGMMLLVLFLAANLGVSAFDGSKPEAGKSYYLFNIYQGKFLGSDCKLSRTEAAKFAVRDNSMTVGGQTWALAEKGKYYQLKNGNQFFAFEDKQVDPANPTDENRALYLGGGVTCQPSVNDTDRSYWQLISEEEYAEWQAKKKFTVSSLNVDGMPKSLSLNLVVYKRDFELNPDATEGPGATEIGKRLLESGFDVVGVSEDFNYHSELWNAAWNDGQGVHYNATTHVQKLSQSTATLTNYLSEKPLFKTDGQCLFYKEGVVDRDVLMSTEKRTAWNAHNGYTDQGADGLITKGFRYYVVKLADGTEVDLYTMHMDADDGQGDRDARASQLQQLVTAIKATHNGRPIIIIGDSNTRYTRDKVKSILIDGINADERFTIRDPWIQYGRDGVYPAYPSGSIMASTNGYLKGEVVDKIWYINNTESNIRLVAETYCQDLSFVASEDVAGTSLKKGSPLCDHKPCAVTFSYHEYNAEIDDQPVDETVADNGKCYFRNRETGRYLMNAGWWGSHAVVGNYPKLEMTVNALSNGKYNIESQYGHITDAAYVDNSNPAEYIAEWELIEKDDFFVLAYEQNGEKKALTAYDPTYFNDNPIYRYVTTASLDVEDKHQQWEMVTEEMLNAEIAKATADNPVNVSHYIKSANFDRIDWGGAGWTFDNKGNSSWGNYSVTESIGGADNDPFCNFNRSVNTKKVGTSSKNQWDCYQELNVPAGYYVVTNQGFEKGTECTYLYAWSNPEGSYVEKTVRLATYNNDLSAENQTEAGRAFDQNKYQNVLPVLKVGADGKLVVGVKKTGNNSTAGWMVFDNFQLYYLGTENPNREYDYDVIGSTRKAEMVDGALTLSGTWREADMAELSAKIGENSPLLLDASANNFLVAQPEVLTANAPANMMIKVANAADVANTQNVIANGQCANFVLTDKEDFAPQQGFVAGNVNYTRTNTQGYNTVCMPFDLKVSDFPETCEVYTFSNQNENTAYFVEADGDIAAGTPVLVKDAAYEWEMALASRNVVANTAEETEGLNGAFVKCNLGEGYFKLNSAGTKFVKTTNVSDVFPFRFYLKESTPSNVKSIAVAINGEETSIEELLNDPETKVEATYDINGRKVISITRPGLYIQGGKKVYVK